MQFFPLGHHGPTTYIQHKIHDINHELMAALGQIKKDDDRRGRRIFHQ